jgi:hypothetical protein
VAEVEAFERQLARQWSVAALSRPQKRRRGPVIEVEDVAHWIEAEVEFLTEHSYLAHAILDFFKQADRELKILTNDAVDLQLVLALALDRCDVWGWRPRGNTNVGHTRAVCG